MWRHFSQAILDADGAESLYGRGGVLFNDNNREVVHLRTTYIDSKYIERITAVPKVFVTRMLRDHDGNPMREARHSLHTLASEHGWTRICHYGTESWTPGVSLYKIYIKCALWLNIYEVHLKTGKPMEYYLKRQA